jgi:hypothetical protein
MNPERLADLIDGFVKASLAPVLLRLAEIEARPPPEPGKDGTNVTRADVEPLLREMVAALPPAEHGKDGTSVTLDDVRPLVEKAVAAIPAAKDGKDGVNGNDGKSVTIDEVRGYLDGLSDSWALSFERRAQELLQRQIDRIEKPKDGKDGRDGVSFDEFHVEQIDERTVRETWLRDGAVVKTFDRKTPSPVYREIYRQGQSYERGDMVTFGGSVWCALRDTESKPGTDDSWRLAVKAGRDGRGRE